MTDLMQSVRDFIDLFERMDVVYALMGGIAVSVHGIPRPTHDVDFTLAIDRAHLSDLYRAVRGLGYTVPEEFERGWIDQVAGMPLIRFRLYLEGRGIDVDVFLAESAFQYELLGRRRRAEVDGLSAWFVTPEDLILLKLLAGRPRDLADIGDVLFTQGRRDEDYLRLWADRLGVREPLEQVLADHPGI